MIISPTITAYNDDEYTHHLGVLSGFAKNIHIDLMDNDFTDTSSVAMQAVRWPKSVQADIHVMYKDPTVILHELIERHPRVVIAHAESEHVSSFIHELHEHRIKTGIALLQDTPIEALHHFINVIDHVLIFSGHLGHHGGEADLALLEKVKQVRRMRPDIEIGWDGGINEHNIVQLKEAGVDVFNIGSAIAHSENPESTYHHLKELLQ
jgi:ribulose-phosphate 3-epimerase